MTLTRTFIFVAIFSNINCIWPRDTHLAPILQDQILLDILVPQRAMDITEKLTDPKVYYKEKKEDSRVRLLRKRDFNEASVGKIRIL